MTKYMAKEENLVPWETVFDTLVEIKDLLTYTETYPLFQEYIQDLVRAHYRYCQSVDFSVAAFVSDKLKAD